MAWFKTKMFCLLTCYKSSTAVASNLSQGHRINSLPSAFSLSKHPAHMEWLHGRKTLGRSDQRRPSCDQLPILPFALKPS